MSKNLNVVVSTNTMRHALHEACLWSLESEKKLLRTSEIVCCMLEFVDCHQYWTIHDWYRAIYSNEKDQLISM